MRERVTESSRRFPSGSGSSHIPGRHLRVSLFILLLIPVHPASAGDWTFKVLDSGRLNGVHFVNEWTGWVVGDSGKVFKTTDGGESWTPQVRVTFHPLNSVSFVDSNVGYAVGDMNTIIKTTDGGAGWSVISTPGFSEWVKVHFADEQTGWMLNSPDFGDGIVRKTTDGGSTWTDLDMLGTAWDMYFRDGTNGWLARHDTISRTSDGTNWSHHGVTSPTTIDRISFPAESLAYGLTLFDTLTGSSYISKSTDGGVLWDTVASYATPVRDISFPDTAEGWATGGGHSGGTVDRTTNGGSTWEREVSLGVGNPFYGLLVKSWFVGSDHGWVVGFTFFPSQCLVGRYQDATTGIDESPALASECSLAQNYPNPFNPATRIDYALPASGTVNLSVFNILGQKVAELVNGFQESGRNSVVFDASRFPGGMYTCRITAGSFTDSKKMILLR